MLGIHHPVITGCGNVKHQPPFFCSPDCSRVKQEQIWIPEIKKHNSELPRLSTGVSIGIHVHALSNTTWSAFQAIGRLCRSWAGMLSHLITFRWSAFLPFKKGRMGRRRVEVVWGYFAVTVNLRAADATSEKTLARHRFAKLLFAYANLVIGQTMLLIILSTHNFLTFMHNCSIGASQLEHGCAYINICNGFLNLFVWGYRWLIEAITLCTVTGLHYFGWQFSSNSLLNFFKGHCWVLLVEELTSENEKDPK